MHGLRSRNKIVCSCSWWILLGFGMKTYVSIIKFCGRFLVNSINNFFKKYLDFYIKIFIISTVAEECMLLSQRQKNN